MTVAMYIAKYSKDEIPKEWMHNENVKNQQGYTIGNILKQNNENNLYL